MEAAEDSEEDFQLFSLEEKEGKEGVSRHSILKAPHSLPKIFANDVTSGSNSGVFNILMADTSGSMKNRWIYVIQGWQTYISKNLTGRTKIYVFDTYVRFLRNDKSLLMKDFTGFSTNLTAAFETIWLEISSCQETHVNVFLITDGQHNSFDNEMQPEILINQMAQLPGKVVCVYVLGIGIEFPVAYSIDIRSHLHSGNSNLPTLFWAKEDTKITEQMSAIGAELTKSSVLLDLNFEGYILPGADKTTHIHPGEWLYFPQPPEDLTALEVKVNNKESRPLNIVAQEIEMSHLMGEVFRQWNSVLIQLHRKGNHIPYDTFDLMESIFNHAMDNLKKSTEKGGAKSRLCSKLVKTYDTEYATLMNQSKRIFDLENKYHDELQLAEDVLKTTVTNRKYDQKNLRLKGHGFEEFEDDVKAFKNLYNIIKGRIHALPSPSLDQSCRLTATSTLEDLQDPDFNLMLTQDKFTLLKTLSMTGIPAYAPIQDASQINPWTIIIKHMLVSPYDILSQTALEAYAENYEDYLDSTNKSVQADKANNKTRFNIIIPLVPAYAAKVLKPLVNTNLYSILTTFCILKNPHIVDHNAHIAALGAAWISTIRNYPRDNRPEFIVNRLESIIATAKLYMDRLSIKTYIKALISDPDQALMTESTRKFDGHEVKCESLVKPMFFLYIKKHKLTEKEKEMMLQLLLAEFMGRCLPNSMDFAKSTPYTEYFAKDINSSRKRDIWMQTTLKSLQQNLQEKHNSLLEAFYTLEDLNSAIKKLFKDRFHNLSGSLSCDSLIAIDMEKIKDLRNVGGCGDIRTSDFKSWAQEMDLPLAKIKKAASPKMVSIYACEALEFPNSRDRVSKVMLTEEEAMSLIKHQMNLEFSRCLKQELLGKLESTLVSKWREEYTVAHKDVVMPISVAEVVELAQMKGVDVTHDTFNDVYKRYNHHLQLLRNACQIPKCPHYLMPYNNFNQHLSVERERANFPHALHLASKEHRTQDVAFVLQEVAKGTFCRRKQRPQPRPPQLESLDYLKGQVTHLMNRYSEGEGS